MSVQRRRGQPAKVWPQKLVANRRGDEQYVADMDATPYEVTAAFLPLRGSRAEVPGQQQISIYTMVFDADLPGVGLWSRVFWRGAYWDVVAPPTYHHGTRSTRHFSMDIRERPSVIPSG